MSIPADLLVNGAKVTAEVESPKGTSKIKDWKIKAVKRSGKQISGFDADYSSKEMNKVKWSKGSKVNLAIDYGDVREPEILTFVVSEYKNNPLIPDKVVFKQK